MKKSGSLRVFISVNIPENLKSGLKAVISQLKKPDAHVRWVPKDNLHISLAFIGDIFEETLPELNNVIDEVCRAYSPFHVQLSGVNTFGRQEAPRVIWVGVADGDVMQELHSELRKLLSAVDVTLEDRPFIPHITLGRVKSGRNKISLMESLKTFKTEDFGKMTVNSIEIMRSILTSDGAVHSQLYSGLLGEEQLNDIRQS